MLFLSSNPSFKSINPTSKRPVETAVLRVTYTCVTKFSTKHLSLFIQKAEGPNKKHLGHSCKIGNMRPPGTLENQNPQFEKIFKFGLLFKWSYHIQWGKNAGPPCLTHRPFSGDFFKKSDVPGGQKKITLWLWHAVIILLLCFDCICSLARSQIVSSVFFTLF